MKRDFFAFSVFLLIVLSCFSFFYLFPVLGSDSTMTKPSMKFKEWQVGRSDKGTDINKDEHKSFITTTQTSCHFRASVVYASDPSQNTSPIDPSTVVWSITGASHNMSLNKKTLKHNWSGSSPSQMASDTSFNVVGSLNVPEVVGLRDHRYKKNGVWKTKKVPDYKSSTSCTANDENRSKRKPVHRGGKKMKFNIKFSAQTEAKHKVEVVLYLEADDLDQIRQEYVDYNRTVPGRSDSKWTAENTYDFGHYKKMMDVGLATKMSDWVKEINKLRGTNEATGELIPAFKVSDFVLNSGYRNPHHNFDHANSTALLSPHMYGYALDVSGKKNSKGNDLDINNDGENTDADRQIMRTAAKPNASARYTRMYSTKHVHADWAPSGWASRSSTAAAAPKMFTLPTQGTETPVSTTPETPETPSTPETAMHPCSVHETTVTGDHSWITPACGDSAHAGYACQISSDHNTAMSGWSGTFYECQPHTNFLCGHTDPTANAAYHAPQTSCTQTNANGQSCTVTNFYECDQHTHVYPAPTVSCWRTACTQTVSSLTEHRRRCPGGHDYWTCNTANLGHHILRSCRYSVCGQTWRYCVTYGTPLCNEPWRKANGLPCWQK